MAKIFSILTVLAAALALYLGLESGKRVKELQAAGEKQVGQLKSTQSKLKATEAELDTTKQTLATTQADLETTRTKLRETETKLTTATTELTTVKADLEKANGELAAVKQAIEAAIPGGLVEIGKLKETMADFTAKIKDQEAKVATLEKEKAELNATVQTLEAAKVEQERTIATQGTKIKKYRDGVMEKNIRGRVMAVNSGWGFCVLNIGDNQGAAANRTLIVTRGGRGIGRVRITSVEATQSVADILPNTFLRGMYVQPGDGVIYTGDDKVTEEPATTESPTTGPSGTTNPVPPLPQP